MTTHNAKPTREQLTGNTIILAKANDRYKLTIKEALLIMNNAPSLNIQFDNFTNILKLYNHRNQPTQFKQANSISYTPSTRNNSSSPSLLQSPSSPVLSEYTSTPPLPPPSPAPLLPALSSPPPSLSTPPSSTPPPPPHSLVPVNRCKVFPFETYESEPITGVNSPRPMIIKNIQYSTASLPDFDQVLLRFGIDYSVLKHVPLKDYRWWEFYDFHESLSTPSASGTLHEGCEEKCTSQYNNLCTQSSECLNNSNVPCDQNSPTISQRIRSMVRGARRECNLSTNLIIQTGDYPH